MGHLVRKYRASVSEISAGLAHTKEEMTLIYLKECTNRDIESI